MSVAGVRNRESFGSVAGPYRVLAGDTGLITLVPAPLRSTIYVQKIHIQITTPSGGELWTFQDGKGVPLVPSVSAGAITHFDFNFGPDGVPCTAASAFVLNITGATGAVGWVTWTAFQQLVPVEDYASLILALNPLGYWRFEEPGGNILFDASGNFHHAFGGNFGAAGADLRGVIFRQPSALRNGTFGIQGVAEDGLGLFPVTITASAVVGLKGTITYTWAGIPAVAQSATNWITLTKVGRKESQYSGWTYITNTGSGSITVPVDNNGGTPLEPGYYDVRLYYKDNWNAMQQILGQVLVAPTAPSATFMVSSPSPAPLVLGTTCTFELWFTLHGINAAGYGFICGDNSNGLYVYTNAGVVWVSLYYLGDHFSSPITMETKNHLAVVCNAGAVTFYLNGQPWGTAAGWPGITISNLLNTFPNTSNVPFVADIDELVLYGTALPPEIVAAHAARWS